MTVSNAALRPRRMRILQAFESIDFRRSFVTQGCGVEEPVQSRKQNLRVAAVINKVQIIVGPG